MKIKIRNKTKNFKSYRAERVKSLFNPERGDKFNLDLEIDMPKEWKIGVIAGPSGSGKTSIGRVIIPGCDIEDLYAGWNNSEPIIDDILPGGDFDKVTSALSAVGLGTVPAWLRNFGALSNGQQFRAGLARALCNNPKQLIIDEFTSVVDRQIAKIGALAFSKSWKRTENQCVLITPHYDIIDWIEPDWVLDTKDYKFVEKKTLPGNGLKYSSIFSRSTVVTGSTLKSIII